MPHTTGLAGSRTQGKCLRRLGMGAYAGTGDHTLHSLEGMAFVETLAFVDGRDGDGRSTDRALAQLLEELCNPVRMGTAGPHTAP